MNKPKLYKRYKRLRMNRNYVEPKLDDEEVKKIQYRIKSNKIKQNIMKEIQNIVVSVLSIPEQQTRLRHSVNQTLNALDLLKKDVVEGLIKRLLRKYIRKNKVDFDSQDDLIDGLITVMTNIISSAIKDGPINKLK